MVRLLFYLELFKIKNQFTFLNEFLTFDSFFSHHLFSMKISTRATLTLHSVFINQHIFSMVSQTYIFEQICEGWGNCWSREAEAEYQCNADIISCKLFWWVFHLFVTIQKQCMSWKCLLNLKSGFYFCF